MDLQLHAAEDKIAKAWFNATGGVVPELGEDLGVGELTLDDEKKTTKMPFYDVAFNYVGGIDLEAIARKAGLRGEIVDEEVAAVETKDDVAMAAAEEPKVVVEKGKGWGFGLFGRR